MDWKEVFKVSGIHAVVAFIFMLTFDWMGPGSESLFVIWQVPLYILFPLSAGLILHKKLKKDEWAILGGITLTFVLLIILYLLDDVFFHLL